LALRRSKSTARLSWPSRRGRLMARPRIVAITRGAFPVLTTDLSSWLGDVADPVQLVLDFPVAPDPGGRGGCRGCIRPRRRCQMLIRACGYSTVDRAARNSRAGGGVQNVMSWAACTRSCCRGLAGRARPRLAGGGPGRAHHLAPAVIAAVSGSARVRSAQSKSFYRTHACFASPAHPHPERGRTDACFASPAHPQPERGRPGTRAQTVWATRIQF
jgi:hypothetical protein